MTKLLRMIILSLILSMGSLSLSAQALKDGGAFPYDRVALEAFVRYALLWGPEIRVEFVQAVPSLVPTFKEVGVRAIFQGSEKIETIFVSDDGKRIILGSVFDRGQERHRATASRISIKNQPQRGSPDGAIDLVVFSDFQCPLCRKLSAEIKSHVESGEIGGVRVVFKDLPIAAKHPWALDAAIAGRCAFRSGPKAFWAYHDWIYSHQTEITTATFRSKVSEAIAEMPIDAATFEQCVSTKSTLDEVETSKREAAEIGVSGTPTIFLNGRKMEGPSWPLLRSAIDFEIKMRAEADCGCSVGPPTKPN